jgi:Cu(I)/Ag(I) efflux system membrane fusion protein
MSGKYMLEKMGIILVTVLAILMVPVSCTGEGRKDTREVLYYVNPMNPAVKSDKPMKDPMGMDYIPVYKEDSVQASHREHSNADLREVSAVTLSESDEKKISVQTTPVVYKKFETRIKTVGRIGYNEQSWVHVSSRFSGRVEILYANFAGTEVKKGEPLLEIYSPAIITVQQEMLQFHRLFSREANSMNQNLFETSKNKIRLWGISERQIDEILADGKPLYSIPVLSPISGTVIAKNVTSGMYISEGEMLFEIADLGEVWAEADLYEQDAGRVKSGDLLEMTLPAYPGSLFRGRITFINPTLDSVTRTIKIRGNFPNKEYLLKPNMYAEITLRSLSGKESLIIPDSALLDTGKRKIVYVGLGNGRYAGRNVVVGARSGGMVSILSGLEQGEDVVTYGAFLIDSQAQLSGNYSITYGE